jgi:hypothetical protein
MNSRTLTPLLGLVTACDSTFCGGTNVFMAFKVLFFAGLRALTSNFSCLKIALLILPLNPKLLHKIIRTYVTHMV